MRILKRGMTGEDVRYLQYLLGIEADGSYGPATERAHKKNPIQVPDFIVHTYSKEQVWFAGTPYEALRKPLKHLDAWAKEEGADRVYNLAFFNMNGVGYDRYGPIRGRTLTYLKGKGYDIGYNSGMGTVERIEIDAGNICGGYKIAIDAGKKKPVSVAGRRARRANGILRNGRYFEVLSLYPVTEAAIRDYMAGNYQVALMLLQDGGGSAAFYDAKANVLISPEGRKENRNYGRQVASVVCVKMNMEPKICPTCGREMK